MSTPDPSLQRQIEELARRLEAVERALGVSDVVPLPPPPSAFTPFPPPPSAEHSKPVRTEAPPTAPGVLAHRFVESRASAAASLVASSETSSPEQPAAPAAALTTGSRPAAPAPSANDLERTIGSRWFAAIGAVVVVVGVALFLKLAYDRGWLDRVPPVGKCLSGAFFSLALLGAGEVTRRKINALASAGLTAAGVGALYASAYAAHGVYNLIGHAPAFLFLAAASGIGIFVSARARLASVALLALVGAYLVPLILGGEGHPAVFPAYLLALLAVGLGLAGWSPRPFFILRPVAWWGTILLGTTWIGTTGKDHPAIALPFLAAFWAAVHISLSAAARRGGIVPLDAATPRLATLWRRMRPIAGSFTTTAWCAFLAAAVLAIGTAIPSWMAYAGGAGAALLFASMLAGNLRVLRDVPRTDSERLGAALLMQAGAMVIVAVALAFRGGMEVVAWLALGVAAVGAGRWIGSRGLDVYGLIILTIGAARLLMLEWWTTNVAATGVHALGFYLTQWTLLIVLAGVAWLAAAELLRRGPDEEGESVVLRPLRARSATVSLAVGMTLLALSVLHTRTHFASGATSLLALSFACSIAASVLRSRAVAVYSAAPLALIVSLALARAPWGADALPLTPLTRGPVLLGLAFSWWMYVVLLASAAAFAWASAVLSAVSGKDRSVPGGWRSFARVGSTAGVAALFAAFLHLDSSPTAVTLVWAALSLAVTWAHAPLPRLAFNVLGPVGLFATTLAWVAAFFGRGADWFAATAPIGLHPGLWTAIAVILAGAAVLRILHRPAAPGDRRADPLARSVIGALMLLMLAATSAEAARLGGLISADPAARGAAVSVWWGLFAAGLLAFGFRAGVPVIRHCGLGLLLVATAKAALVDLASAPQEWRVASFIGLGLLMLGVAVVYSRLSARLAGAPPAGPHSSGAVFANAPRRE